MAKKQKSLASVIKTASPRKRTGSVYRALRMPRSIDDAVNAAKATAGGALSYTDVVIHALAHAFKVKL